jgi:hypothetical protein
MIRTTIELEKRLAQLKQEVPLKGLDRHPSKLKNISDLPVELRSPCVTALAVNETIQTIIAFPPQIQRGHHYVPKQVVLFTPTEVIHLLAPIWPNEEPQIVRIKGGGLMYMKVTLLLLYGFLEIVGLGHTQPARLGMEFNTVAWYGLSMPLYKFLQATKPTPNADIDKSTYSRSTQQAFEKLPLKFSNGVKIYALLPGENLEDMVFQPATWKRRLLSFRKATSANTLLVLTSNFVAVIQEELEVAQGWIVSYIPRSSIVGIISQPRGEWNELIFQLKRGDQIADYKLLLKSEAADVWLLHWTRHGGQWQES